ncbi:hypothetical protein Dda_0471 [Drechslerella dactyloides]|uniref:Uncharacterized protein n=1 Tax=Drechslerella dactyloides TaxID=74499 RepID=A0AAD6NM01_DREDA|nr:hypothetical protein Dda_0471 [Drechslerella dactyloides]
MREVKEISAKGIGGGTNLDDGSVMTESGGGAVELEQAGSRERRQQQARATATDGSEIGGEAVDLALEGEGSGFAGLPLCRGFEAEAQQKQPQQQRASEQESLDQSEEEAPANERAGSRQQQQQQRLADAASQVGTVPAERRKQEGLGFRLSAAAAEEEEEENTRERESWTGLEDGERKQGEFKNGGLICQSPLAFESNRQPVEEGYLEGSRGGRHDRSQSRLGDCDRGM